MFIALIILVNILFYIRTLKYQGICDDIPIFNLDKKMPTNWWAKFWWHLHGYKYTDWKLAHYQTLSIHTINCVLIYIAFGSNYTSLIAALLFSVNPINNQCSIWLSGKCYSMNTTYALLMWIFPIASPLIYIFATYFCGASIILFPLVFLFTKHWYLAALVIVGFLREHQRIFNKKSPVSKFNTESNAELMSIAPRKLIVAFKTLGYHFINAIIALRLGYYHKYLFLHGVSKDTNKESYKIDKYFFIGIALVLLTLYTRNIGLIWFCITIGMWCNFISFSQTIANRYVYLPNVGLTIFISSLIHPYIAIALFTYYATKLLAFRIFYLNEYWSIEYACMEQPDFFYPWQNRAVHCFQNANFQGALGNMLKCDTLRPNDWKINYNLAQIYMMLGNMSATREWFKKAQGCMIDGREKEIGALMKRLEDWIIEVETQAKNNNNNVSIDIKKFDMQR